MKRIVPIAKEGWPFVGIPILAGGAVAALGWIFFGTCLLGVGLALGLFFRDPERQIPDCPQGAICPADGKVITVSEVDEKEYLNARSQRVSIFMSVFNVHMNYAPIAGKVEFLEYRKGRFHRANLPEASVNNENNSIGIKSEGHQVMVRQIAGALARRIVCRVRVNDPVKAGQKIGLIKFGSRVDVFVPLGWEVLVKAGDRVKGGISQIARFS